MKIIEGLMVFSSSEFVISEAETTDALAILSFAGSSISALLLNLRNCLMVNPKLSVPRRNVASDKFTKPVAAKASGKLVKLLKEGETPKAGQTPGFIESTANHNEVISLLDSLKYPRKPVQLNPL